MCVCTSDCSLVRILLGIYDCGSPSSSLITYLSLISSTPNVSPGTSGAPGKFLVAGLQIGNVFLGVQPLLGVEGDPMRLLFERDLTPHPQYAAFYKWLQNSLKPDCIVHFGAYAVYRVQSACLYIEYFVQTYRH
jgi:hypothetical protein